MFALTSLALANRCPFMTLFGDGNSGHVIKKSTF
jgi:hypothetical protein